MSFFLGIFNLSFLKNLDRYLLLNHTVVWNIRIHYIVFYGIIIDAILLLFLFYSKFEIYQVSTVYYTIFFPLLISSAISLIYWLIFQKDYIPSKEYGIYKLNGISEYLLYLFSIFFILLPIIILIIVAQDIYYFSGFEQYNYFNIDKAPKNIVFDLANSSSVKIARSNFEFISSWNDSKYFILWCLGVTIFFPLAIIIYRNVGMKSFMFSFLYIAVLLVLFGIVASMTSIPDKELPLFIFLLNFALLFVYQAIKDKSSIIFSIFILNFFAIFVFFDVMDFRFIRVTESEHMDKVINFLIASLIFIISIISPLEKLLVKVTSTPKR